MVDAVEVVVNAVSDAQAASRDHRWLLDVPSSEVGVLADAIGVPLVYWFNGGYPQEVLDQEIVAGNHSPHFAPVAQPTLDTGLRAALAVVMSRCGR